MFKQSRIITPLICLQCIKASLILTVAWSEFSDHQQIKGLIRNEMRQHGLIFSQMSESLLARQ